METMHHFGKSHFRHYNRTLQIRTHINTATAAAALRPFCLRISCLVSLRFYLASWVSPQRQGKVTGTVCRSPPPGGGVGKGGRGRAVASPIWGARRPAQPDACLQQPAALLSVLASIALGAHCSGPSDGSGTAARLAPKLVRLWAQELGSVTASSASTAYDHRRTLQIRTHINTATAAAALRPFCLRISITCGIRHTARKAQKKLPVFWAQKKPGVFFKKLPTGSFFGVGSFLVGSFFARLAVWSHRRPRGGGRPR
jgi:hypothetical protein